MKSEIIYPLTKIYRETVAIAQRILIELARRKRSLIFWTIFPITILIINGLIMEERANLLRGEAFAQAAPGSLVGAALFFSCLGGSIATVVAEREQRTLKRLFVSPLSGLSYFLGIFLAHSCIGMGQALLVILSATLAGATFSGSFLLATFIITLSIVIYVGVGFILGTQFAQRTEDVNALIAAFGVPLLLLGGAFVPTSVFPKSLLNLAHYNPIYHMTEALFQVITNNARIGEIKVHLIFLTSFSFFVTLGGWFFYRRMLYLERRF
jgi:ABC-2 type transport system permease protein